MLVDVGCEQPLSIGSSDEPSTFTRRVAFALTACVLASFFIIGLFGSVYGPALPHIAAQTNTSASDAGSLIVARSIGWISGSALGGVAYSVFPSVTVYSSALSLLCLGIVTLPALSSLSLMFVMTLVGGIGAGLVEMGSNTLLLWIWKDKAAPSLQLGNLAIALGALCSPLILGGLIPVEGYDRGVSTSFWLIVVLSVPVVAVLSWLPSPVQPPDLQEEDAQAAEQDEPSRAGASNRSYYGVLASLTLFTLVISGSEVGMGSWLFEWGEARWSLPERSDLLTSVYYGGFSLGRLFGAFSARLLPSSALCLLEASLVLLASALLLFSSSDAAVWAGVGCFGLGLGPLFATALAMPGEEGMRLSPAAVSVIIGGSNVGELLFPLLLSLLWGSVGPMVLPATCFALSIATLAVLGALLYAIKTYRFKEH